MENICGQFSSREGVLMPLARKSLAIGLPRRAGDGGAGLYRQAVRSDAGDQPVELVLPEEVVARPGPMAPTINQTVIARYGCVGCRQIWRTQRADRYPLEPFASLYDELLFWRLDPGAHNVSSQPIRLSNGQYCAGSRLGEGRHSLPGTY